MAKTMAELIEILTAEDDVKKKKTRKERRSSKKNNIEINKWKFTK